LLVFVKALWRWPQTVDYFGMNLANCRILDHEGELIHETTISSRGACRSFNDASR
jgi:hypothetical protein